MVLHLRAPKGKVSVEVMLNRAKYFDRTGKVNDHTIYLSGNLGKNALEFAMCLSAKAKGGRVYTMGLPGDGGSGAVFRGLSGGKGRLSCNKPVPVAGKCLYSAKR